MHSVLEFAAPGVVAPIRIICLPGAYHSAADFQAAGFAGSVRSRKIPVDLVFVDTEMEYVGDRRLRAQLHHQIVTPARAAGCRFVWLAGISLGGYLGLDYAAVHPGGLDGVCLLAPYLGNRILTTEIARAGGLRTWLPDHPGDEGELADGDEERRIWRFLKAEAGHFPLYLGFGREDRFAVAHRLLADALPPTDVDVIPGGHDWRTWKILWENFLESRFT